MSRINKTVTINDKTITVKELTVRQIKVLLQELSNEISNPALPTEESERALSSNQDFVNRNWALCVEGMALEETEDLTPSELKLVYDAFYEVNKVFFDLALQVEGENPIIRFARIVVQNTLIRRYAILLNAGMLGSGTTDTVSS